jgi:uncharacterized membrane protein
MPSFIRNKYIANPQLLNFWGVVILIAIGAGLRFSNLTLKMVWADEIASIVHGLGNSFTDVASNKVISLAALLKPLEVNHQRGLIDVMKYGTFEDFIPPLHFLIMHVWMRAFQTSDQLFSVFTARSLSVCLSLLSIPATYLLSKEFFPANRKSWFLAAGIITFSPYSIALAQEIRHYSIAIIFVALSILLFFRVSAQIVQARPFHLGLLCLLASTNLLGMASHYFFVVVSIAEVLTLLIIAYQYKLSKAFKKISIAVLINSMSVLAWLPVYALNHSRDELTAWAQIDITKIEVVANLLLQFIVSSITMFFLLPVESPNTIITIISGILMLTTLVLLSWLILRGIKNYSQSDHDFSARFLTLYIISSMITLISLSCIFRKDFLTSPRYHFIYFPALIVLLSYFVCCAFNDNQPLAKIKNITIKKANIFYLFAIVLFASSLCVIDNLCFLKPFNADIMANIIQSKSGDNALVITNNTTLIDTSHLLALGWQFAQGKQPQTSPTFFLDRFANDNATRSASQNTKDQLIQNALQSVTGSTSIWLVNYVGEIHLDRCTLTESNHKMSRSGYKHYFCPPKSGSDSARHKS